MASATSSSCATWTTWRRHATILKPAYDSPAVHLALVTGLTEGEHRLQIEGPEVRRPAMTAKSCLPRASGSDLAKTAALC